MNGARDGGASVRAIDAKHDLDVVARLHGRCFPDDPWSASAFARLLALPGCLGLVALADGGGIVGVVVLQVVADEAEILTIAVDPRSRGRGLGGALLGQGSILAAARGARTLFLEVAEDNAPALALYRRAGFRSCGRRPAYYRRRSGATVDALVLRRDLEVE